MTMQDTEALVRSAFDAYNHHASDNSWLDRSLAPVADDCEMIDIPQGMTLRGKDGFKQFLLSWSTAFPNSQLEITNLFAAEDFAVVEFIGRGTHTGLLQGRAGDIAPTGKKLEMRNCQVFQVKDGKIMSVRLYYDAMSMMQQLGLAPAMGDFGKVAM